MTTNNYNYTKLGFVGSTMGMSLQQHAHLLDYLETLHNCIANQIELHICNCVGAEYEMYHIGKTFGYYIITHSFVEPLKYRTEYLGNEILSLVSNRYVAQCNIINCCDNLIAIPNFDGFNVGDTWKSIMYANSIDKFIKIIQ